MDFSKLEQYLTENKSDNFIARNIPYNTLKHARKLTGDTNLKSRLLRIQKMYNKKHNQIEKLLKDNNVYTLKEAAEILGIKEDTLKKQCQQNKREHYKIGSGYRSFYLVSVTKR